MTRETWAACLAGLVTCAVTAAFSNDVLVGVFLGLVATFAAAALLTWVERKDRDTFKGGTR